MKEVITNTIKQNGFKILIAIIFIGMNVYLLTIPAKLLGDIVDLLYDIDHNKILIFKNVIYMLLISIAVLITRVIWRYYVFYFSRSIEKDLRTSLFRHVMSLKISEIQDKKNGEIMSYFVKDIGEIRSCCYLLLSYGSRIIISVILTAGLMTQNVDLRLTLIALFPLAIATIVIIAIRLKIDKYFSRSQKDFTELSEYIQESTDGIRTTKAYHSEEEQIKHFVNVNKKVKDSNYKVSIFSSLLSASINICFGLSYGLTILFGTGLVLNGSISVGAFVTFISYIGLLISPVSFVPTVISRFRRAKISYSRLQYVFKMEREPKLDVSKKSNERTGILKGDIEIKNLSFSYPGYLNTVLNNININIKQGETLGIIGKIGSGKSTLMNLLVKLYAVKRDKIIINDLDINDIPAEILRENICYITQDNFLFSATVKDNINLFRNNYDDDEIRKSTRNAMIFDEIMSLPDNIHTVIGERGVDLSGGQRQRIIISRAFLSESDIVIFDDTFSALDNRTEQKLLKNIKKLVEGKTCIIVSNRISDIKHADRIIVLDEGNIIEDGTHKELIEKEGAYHTFYKEQAIKTEESMLS